MFLRLMSTFIKVIEATTTEEGTVVLFCVSEIAYQKVNLFNVCCINCSTQQFVTFVVLYRLVPKTNVYFLFFFRIIHHNICRILWYKHVMVRALNLTKDHTFSVPDETMKCGTDNLDIVLLQNCDITDMQYSKYSPLKIKNKLAFPYQRNSGRLIKVSVCQFHRIY